MKKIQILVMAVLAAVFSSCKPGLIYEDAIASVVYFVEAVDNPVKTVGVPDLDKEGCVSYTIYNAGNNSSSITVNVSVDDSTLDIFNVKNSTSLKMMPKDYYSIGQSSFVLDTKENYRQTLKVRLDVDRFLADGLDPEDYILALTIASDDVKSVSPDNKSLFIKFAK